jgi:hypothetical protein
MSLSLERTTTSRAAVPAGLPSAEAARRRVEFGPNAVVEERVHPLKQVARHFWAPVPWMLEATIALYWLRVSSQVRSTGRVLKSRRFGEIALADAGSPFFGGQNGEK